MHSRLMSNKARPENGRPMLSYLINLWPAPGDRYMPKSGVIKNVVSCHHASHFSHGRSAHRNKRDSEIASITRLFTFILRRIHHGNTSFKHYAVEHIDGVSLTLFTTLRATGAGDALSSRSFIYKLSVIW